MTQQTTYIKLTIILYSKHRKDTPQKNGLSKCKPFFCELKQLRTIGS